jgi:hypothetical protein
MPLPIFAIGTAIVKGAKAVGKSPIFQNAMSAAKTAAGNTMSGSNTNVITTGSTQSYGPTGQVGSSNNMLLIGGAAIVALFLFSKK